jgi:hypothetical protein
MGATDNRRAPGLTGAVGTERVMTESDMAARRQKVQFYRKRPPLAAAYRSWWRTVHRCRTGSKCGGKSL